MRDVVIIENGSEETLTANDYGDDDDSAPVAWTGTETVGLLTQMQSSEDSVDRETRVTEYMLLLGPEVEIFATSRVRWQPSEDDEDKLFQVVGEPFHAKTSRGNHHIEVRLQGVEG
jgi:hypothetical protein